MKLPSIHDIEKARKNISGSIHRTPVLKSKQINEITGAELFIKCENFQKVGAFKFRGAVNAILNLPDELKRKGVATHSSGNHAQALALAARMIGVRAAIVMPSNSPEVKKKAVEGYGADVVLCEPNLKARESTLAEVIAENGAAEIHPYKNFDVISGQGTAALELMEDAGDLDIFMTPVGGGGLTGGCSTAVKSLKKRTKFFAVEPKGADDAYRSFKSGNWVASEEPDTICDGLLTSTGEINFEIIKKNVDDILTVSDSTVLKAMKLYFERMKIVTEPSGAVTLAAVLEYPELFAGKRTGLVISGGNIDISRFGYFFHGSSFRQVEDKRNADK